MEIFILCLISLMGLCYGSFLNVLIHRTESGESILFPASKCPRCDVPLKWWMNIPIFSYFYLNGRCYYCNKIISIRYPIVEFLGLLLFVFSFSVYKSVFDAISVVIILSLFFVQSVIDMRIKKLSTGQSLLIIFCGLVFNRYNLLGSIIGMLVGALLIFIIQRIGRRFLNAEIFGTGDIFLFGALGSVVCGDKILMYMFYTFLIHLAMYLPIRWRSLKEKSETLPKYAKIFGITCFFLYIIKTKEFFGEKLVYIISLGFLLYSAYFLVKELLTGLQKVETSQYCAIAPAIGLACLIFLI